MLFFMWCICDVLLSVLNVVSQILSLTGTNMHCTFTFYFCRSSWTSAKLLHYQPDIFCNHVILWCWWRWRINPDISFRSLQYVCWTTNYKHNSNGNTNFCGRETKFQLFIYSGAVCFECERQKHVCGSHCTNTVFSRAENKYVVKQRLYLKLKYA